MTKEEILKIFNKYVSDVYVFADRSRVFTISECYVLGFVKELGIEIQEELKLCPLCKESSLSFVNGCRKVSNKLINDIINEVAIKCNNCGLTTRFYENKADLIKYWNKREEDK